MIAAYLVSTKWKNHKEEQEKSLSIHTFIFVPCLRCGSKRYVIEKLSVCQEMKKGRWFNELWKCRHKRSEMGFPIKERVPRWTANVSNYKFASRKPFHRNESFSIHEYVNPQRHFQMRQLIEQEGRNVVRRSQSVAWPLWLHVDVSFQHESYSMSKQSMHCAAVYFPSKPFVFPWTTSINIQSTWKII